MQTGMMKLIVAFRSFGGTGLKMTATLITKSGILLSLD